MTFSVYFWILFGVAILIPFVPLYSVEKYKFLIL